MPFVSTQQRKWAYTKEGMKALGGKQGVAEWEKATGNKKLPKYAPIAPYTLIWEVLIWKFGKILLVMMANIKYLIEEMLKV